MELIIIAICVFSIIGAMVYVYRPAPIKDKMSFREVLDLTGMPVVTFYNNNKKIHFLLDTGATFSNINKSCLKDYVYTESDNYGTTMGIEGNTSSVTQYVELQLSYKDNKYSEEFLPVELDSAFANVKAETGVTLMGILGVSFFEKYQYCLDFKDMVIYSQKKMI